MKFFLIACSVGICSVVRAQTPIVPLTSRVAPTNLKSTYSNSKRGKLVSSFCIDEGKTSTWLLFFERKQTAQEKAANLARNHDDLELGITTLLVVRPVGGKKIGWALQRVIPLGEVSKSDKFSVRWLLSLQKRGIVLIVPRNFNSSFGTTGYELIAFPEGWKQQKAVRQSFQNWMNPIEGASYSFNSVDAKGFLQAEETLTEYGDVPSRGKTITHTWNGSGWTATAESPTSSHGGLQNVHD